jgi:hypothetical protein
VTIRRRHQLPQHNRHQAHDTCRQCQALDYSYPLDLPPVPRFQPAVPLSMPCHNG